MRELLNKVIGNMNLNHVQTTTVCITVFEDNNGPSIAPRTKDITTDYHFFSGKVGAGTHIQIKRVDTQDNIADIFTEGL